MGVLRDKSYLHKEWSLESLHTQEDLGFKLLNSTMFPEASSSVFSHKFRPSDSKFYLIPLIAVEEV